MIRWQCFKCLFFSLEPFKIQQSLLSLLPFYVSALIPSSHLCRSVLVSFSGFHWSPALVFWYAVWMNVLPICYFPFINLDKTLVIPFFWHTVFGFPFYSIFSLEPIFPLAKSKGIKSFSFFKNSFQISLIPFSNVFILFLNFPQLSCLTLLETFSFRQVVTQPCSSATKRFSWFIDARVPLQ